MSIFNQLLGGLAGGAMGLSQQRENAFQKQRLAQSDARQSRTDQFALDDRAKSQDAERVLGQYLKPALMGDQTAQAEVIRVAPHLADRFVKPPTPDEIQYDATRGGRVNVTKNTFEPTPGVAPTPKAPIEGSPEWRENLKTKATIDKDFGYHAPSQSGDMDEQRKFQRAQGLQQDFQGNPAVKKAYGVSTAVSGLTAGLSGESPMDDLSVIYETVKLFDPGSVVKEGEIKLAQSANSLPGRLQLLVSNWNTGRKLTPEMRAQIQELVDRKVSESRRSVAPIQATAGDAARRYGVSADSAYIAPDPFRGVGRDPAQKPPSGNINLGGDTLTAAQKRRAATDPQYAAFLKATGKM